MAQLSLRDLIIKVGLTVGDNQFAAMNPMWDYLLVIEDPVVDTHDTFRCDGVFVDAMENTIHLFMGDQIGV